MSSLLLFWLLISDEKSFGKALKSSICWSTCAIIVYQRETIIHELPITWRRPLQFSVTTREPTTKGNICTASCVSKAQIWLSTVWTISIYNLGSGWFVQELCVFAKIVCFTSPVKWPCWFSVVLLSFVLTVQWHRDVNKLTWCSSTHYQVGGWSFGHCYVVHILNDHTTTIFGGRQVAMLIFVTTKFEKVENTFI